LPWEIEDVLTDLHAQDLSPKEVVINDSITLSNSNSLYVLSHKVGGHTHYGAIIVPPGSKHKKLPVIIFATGGDGMHSAFDISQDFNHAAVQFPHFLGDNLDEQFIVVIPGFRGQELIIGDNKYLSSGNVSDAFEGATTDALAFLNVALDHFTQADSTRIVIYGGSRGGTVALLASSRDQRITRAVAVAAPTDMRALYPEQFKLIFFNDLLDGKIGVHEARKKFISISPIHFVDKLPLVQLHHDVNDPFVPISFAKTLAESMITGDQYVETCYYDEGIHGFWSDKNFWDQVQDFIRPLVD